MYNTLLKRDKNNFNVKSNPLVDILHSLLGLVNHCLVLVTWNATDYRSFHEVPDNCRKNSVYSILEYGTHNSNFFYYYYAE